MSDPTPPVPAYGEDDEAASLAKGAVPVTPPVTAPHVTAPHVTAPNATALVQGAGTTETDIERNRAEAARRAGPK